MLGANTAGCIVGFNCIIQLPLLAMQTDSPHCGREPYLYSAGVATFVILQVIERCGWPLPGEAPGKEELANRVNHRYYTIL